MEPTQVSQAVTEEWHHPPQLLTIYQLVEKHPWATEGGLRWQRFHCATNGFQQAFVTIGRKVLVDETEYFRCVRRQNGQGDD